jgi:hypothetical protein
MTKTHEGGISGIRLTDRERASLGKAMGIHSGAERRRHRRFLLPKEFALVVRIEQPGGGIATFSVTPRDMSTSGIGFFHAAYIHPGTVCTLLMRTLHGDPVSISGCIMRCRHVSGRIHEVGVLFEHEVDIETFVSDANTDPQQPAPIKRDELLFRIGKLAAELKALADQRATNAALLAKVGELAVLIEPPETHSAAPAHNPPVPPPPAPAAPAPEATPGPDGH